MGGVTCAPMPDTSLFVDLASERLGGGRARRKRRVLRGEGEPAPAAPPVLIPDKYTDRGKWMDGWETRRRREPGHDWCIVRLGLPGIVRTVVVDTSNFKGNYPESCSLDAAVVEGYAPASALSSEATWTTVLDRTPLKGDTENHFEVREALATHLRLNIFPDGGVARLRVLGTVKPDWMALSRAGGDVDLAALEHGGLVVACSDMFFGGRQNLVLPGPSRGMHDGWETRRRRGPGHDWAVVRLGRPGSIRRIEVDTSHYKGNAPGSCSLDACRVAPDVALPGPAAEWKTVLPMTPLLPHTSHVFEADATAMSKDLDGGATHVRLNIFPDGGVARLRVFGRTGA